MVAMKLTLVACLMLAIVACKDPNSFQPFDPNNPDPPDAPQLVAPANGWTSDQFAAREEAQQSLDGKRRAADVTIDNSASPEHTQAQVERLWQSLIG